MEESFVIFGVWDFGTDSEQVTSVVGVPPTRSWLKGEPFGVQGGMHTQDGWELNSPSPPTAPIEEKLVDLVATLEEVAPGVRAAAEQFNAGIGCAVYTSQANPGFYITADLIERIAALSLSLDFDVYLLGQNGEHHA